MTIKALLLDADGVVQGSAPDFRSALGALCGNPDSVEAFVDEVFAAERPCLIGTEDFPARLAGILERWRSPKSLAEALQVWEMIEPSAAVLELVSVLRASGLLVALATNQQRHRAQYMTRVLDYGSHFDALFFSCELGVAKPDPEYFHRVLKELAATERGEVLFLDDNARNVTAARTVGLAAEVFELRSGVAELRRLLGQHGL